MQRVGDVAVRGVDLDGETRCTHAHSDRDVVAIRFRCCGEFFARIHCHEALTDHEPAVWPREAFDEAAVCCGICGSTLSIVTCLESHDACPVCGAAFTPGCVAHHHCYVDAERDGDEGLEAD